jgi:PTH1 family peptidyl-tRNA hydrolase
MQSILSALRVIVGLGNPGESYRSSRHNVGFLVVERFSELEGFPPPRRDGGVLHARKRVHGHVVCLVCPQTFMNLSGPAVRDFLEELASPGEVGESEYGDVMLVVHDDLDLPFGKLRFRGRGSSGGHRGVESIMEALGTDGFSRLKVGIGRREGEAASDYVLEPLRGEDEKALLQIAEGAARTLPSWVREGTEAAASRYNGQASPAPPAGKREEESG